MSMHDDQVDVRIGTVHRLIEDQFPQWATMPVREVPSSATDNAVFRIGEELVARLPLRRKEYDEALAWLKDEAAALAELLEVSPVPTPKPVALGEPGRGYPMPWIVQTWLPGHDATVEDPAASDEFADDLASFVSSLRAADTRGRRFAGGGRGGRLTDHDDWMELCFRRSESLLDVAGLRTMWAELRTLPAVDADAMCHGDLTPPNVLVRDGRLAGVLDGGGFGPADPALDLVGAWHLLDGVRREALRRALACGEVQWLRGMAWALQQAMGLVWYYAESNPVMSRWGRRTLERLESHG
jgi:aminoglycoside phosphotransferase (APT) family kinase protein